MADYRGLLVIGEIQNGVITRITKELLSIGRKLADQLSEQLSIILLGSNLSEVARQGIIFGADNVYVAENPLLNDYQSDAYTFIVAKVCQQMSPSVVLLGQTDAGRDLAPRLAARLKGSLSMGCTELKLDPETHFLLQTRPMYGGNVNAVMIARCKPQIATIRPRSIRPAEPVDFRKGEIIPIEGKIDNFPTKYKVINRVREEVEGVKLEDAKVVVAGGRGQGKEGFELIRQLAKLLKGAIGASRPPCDEGWVPSSLQIGQTGKVISPELYIAVGISGAMQHIVSCLSSKRIVAINRDPDAPIFKVSDLGIVGDYREVLPPLIEKCKELLSDV